MALAAPPSLVVHRDALAPLLDGDASRSWLVGGVVRDALLDRPLLDVDVATAGNPERVARRIAGSLGGTAFSLGDRSSGAGGVWRVATDAVDGVQYDVCALRGDGIEGDLAARDFAANALAVPVVGAPQLIDLHGGIDDIEAGRIRMVSVASLDDDPLRMLRAARLAHLLDWEVEPATTVAIRERAARAVEPAGERTFHELQLLLLHPEARRGWRQLEQLGLDRVLLPELHACRGMAQSRFHHLDVHDHTLAVLDNAEDLLAATDFWLPLPIEPGLAAEPWTGQQRLVVLLAALCHDLGKPATRTQRDDGRVGFAGHDDVGREIVDSIAVRWRWSTATRRQVGHLVGTHLALGFLLHTDRGPRDRWKLRQELGTVTPEAIVLSAADRMATSGLDDRRRWVRAHVELARAVWADHWRESRDGVAAPLLDGREIGQVVGIEPGPHVGELVARLAEAQAVGDVSTREDAEQFVASESRDRLP